MTPRVVIKSFGIKKNFIFNHEKYKLFDDVLIGEERLEGFLNRIYIPKNASEGNLLSSYMLSSKKDPIRIYDKEEKMYLSCKFRKPINYKQVLQVKLFNNTKEYIKTIIINFGKEIDETPFIELPINTEKVMVEVVNRSEKYLDSEQTLEDRFHAYKELIIPISINLLFLLIPISYFMLYLLTGDAVVYYMNIRTISIGSTLILGVGVINYFAILGWLILQKRNGVKTYEKQ